MGRVLKYLTLAAAGLIGLVIVAVVLFVLLFDPNAFRDEIAASFTEATGREFRIEGDIDYSLFPWLAIEVGRTTLSNAEGFGDEPMVEFQQARLSVRVIPLILGGNVSIGTAELDSLRINLAVNEQGVSNWQDLVDRGESDAVDETDTADVPADAPAGAGGDIDIGSINFSNGALVYEDRQLGERYSLTDLNVRTGSIGADGPIDIEAGFRYAARPADVSGELSMSTRIDYLVETATVAISDFAIRGSTEGVAAVPVTLAIDAPAMSFDTEQQVADVGDIELQLLDVRLDAAVEPFSYAGNPTPKARLSIAAFSPRTLMQQLGIDAPETADPDALSKLRIDASAAVTDAAISLSDLELVFDDTTFTGELVVPRDPAGTFRLDLAGDRIDVTRYMAPASDEAAAEAPGDAVPVEIPVDLIRALNARGSMTLAEGRLGNMEFGNVELGVNAGGGKVRFHPITAEFFDGRYIGDTRIDASGSDAVLSVDERIEGVSLEPLARAMLGQDNISGRINGRFQLSGRGTDLADVQRTLSGNMSFVLSDGAFEGTDVWYQLRRARAVFRQQEPPQPVLPARTRFSEVSATGQVTNGVLSNDDFSATLPFMQIDGRGTVDFAAATVDYSLSGRVLDKPELVDNATPEEIADLTKATIPFKVTGPLAEPSIGIDFEKLLKDRAQEEIEDVVKDKLKDLFGR